MPLSYGTAIYPGTPTSITFAGSYPGTQAIPGATEYSGQQLSPENNLYPGAATFAGQGNFPIVLVRYSTDDLADATPNWQDTTAKLRNFSTSRGRESELSQFDAGTATVTVDNRDRTFDPILHALITPLNRWWLLEQFSGETRDIFKGYAESYENQWPGGGWSDAECVISLADEFKLLALQALPTTDPPRGSYPELLAVDSPDGYWPLNEPVATNVQPAEVYEVNPMLPPGPPGPIGYDGDDFIGNRRGRRGNRTRGIR